MIASQSITIFKGDTFLADGLYRDGNLNPVDLSNGDIEIEAWLKASNDRKFPIDVTITPTIGTYHLEADTTLWPLGRNNLIVRYTQDDVKRTAQPVIVEVEDA